ncbi:hypothetical protein VE03_10319 [Pseudogymnoascus sp. 23342-1-I1]|nr:hypothetical protein VE03_10319 [Pseudogymnoascus sp. 23342-1-I1]
MRYLTPPLLAQAALILVSTVHTQDDPHDNKGYYIGRCTNLKGSSLPDACAKEDFISCPGATGCLVQETGSGADDANILWQGMCAMYEGESTEIRVGNGVTYRRGMEEIGCA